MDEAGPSERTGTGTGPRDQRGRRAADVEELARILDAAFGIPGTRIRVGVDSILGLVPGVGDWLTSMFSAYIIARAFSLGAPGSVILRMAGNVLADLFLGALPGVGDVADVFWKANLRNAELLRRYTESPERTVRRSRWWSALVAFAFLVIWSGVILLILWVFYLIGSAIFG